MELKVPKEVRFLADTLFEGGFQAYLVGGCVRDLLLDCTPKDWDIATSARPAEMQKLFPESVYENDFGTVGVKTDSEDLQLKVIEVTTFRKEGRYTDKRHPDTITFADTIEEDLARRDFTVNAMAMGLQGDFVVVDPYGGQKDLDTKLIRAVGEAEERFEEDALRLMRAVRFAAELGFEIEEKTASAITKHAGLLEMIAKERIRDEFLKVVQITGGSLNIEPYTTDAAGGVQILEDMGLLKYIIPELREGIGCGQNKHHIYTVWEHNMRALDYAASKEYSLPVRLASLLHDVGKPATKRGDGVDSTFHGHEVVGAKMTARIMDRLRFSKWLATRVIHLVRHHLFYYNVDEVSAAGVRRFLARVGLDYLDDLIKVREADRIGSGVPKAVPYKLRHLLFMVDKVRRDPISPKMLAIAGEDVMRILELAPGPRVGWILSALMDAVLDDPKENTKANLESRITELGDLTDEDLRARAEAGKGRVSEAESGVEREMKKKHKVG